MAAFSAIQGFIFSNNVSLENKTLSVSLGIEQCLVLFPIRIAVWFDHLADKGYRVFSQVSTQHSANES